MMDEMAHSRPHKRSSGHNKQREWWRYLGSIESAEWTESSGREASGLPTPGDVALWM